MATGCSQTKTGRTHLVRLHGSYARMAYHLWNLFAEVEARLSENPQMRLFERAATLRVSPTEVHPLTRCTAVPANRGSNRGAGRREEPEFPGPVSFD